MKRFEIWWCALPMLILGGTSAFANPPDPYKITASEKAACTTDAMRFCAYTYPDAAQLLSCMKSNRTSLSSVCLAAFDAGVKRRHLE